MTGTCPSCGYIFETATSLQVKDAKPKPGDLSLCINCGEFLQFTPSLSVKRMEDGLFYTLPREQRRLLAAARREIIKRGPIRPGTPPA